MLIIPSSLAYISIAEWVFILSQVFGGCCFNVFILENILSNNFSNHSLATIITFCQFLFVAIVSYYPNTDFRGSSWKRLYLRKPQIPIREWVLMVVMFITVSLLNNLIWKFKIGIPFHIVFRSSGTVITMVVGYLFAQKRYSKQQVFASIIISLGTILTTMDSSPKSPNRETSGFGDSKFFIGVSLLFLASIISAFMGLYNETLFKKYGNQWQESLFYTHFLSLPLFLLVIPLLRDEFLVLWDAPEKYVFTNNIVVSKQFCSLLINMVSQYACTKGVNMLSGRTSALSVTVVLLVRKFVSLLISITWYGNKLSTTSKIGASLVFLGALQYGIASSGLKNRIVRNRNEKAE